MGYVFYLLNVILIVHSHTFIAHTRLDNTHSHSLEHHIYIEIENYRGVYSSSNKDTADDDGM